MAAPCDPHLGDLRSGLNDRHDNRGDQAPVRLPVVICAAGQRSTPFSHGPYT